ncbi:glycoside hydrolase family 2 TIM barrel-domain containing protein [Flaviaesturariibacter amylovorans]
MKTCIILLLLLWSSHSASAQQRVRLNEDWEFVRQDLGGIWEAVRPRKGGNPEDVPLWTRVSLPHCVNATDAVDPDLNYYQGPAWYRTQLAVANPYPGGRTVLHFEGAGQKTEVYIHTTKVGSHVGGYDEFSVDITDAVAAFTKTEAFRKQFNGKVPLSVRTDNGRDLELMPSDLSDFNLYGGIYRYLNLVYLPAVSVDRLFAEAQVDSTGKTGSLDVRARFHAPVASGPATVSVVLKDPRGKVLQRVEKTLADLSGDLPLARFAVRAPRLWNVQDPARYTVLTTVTAGGVASVDSQRIGFRQATFVKKGPFLLNGKRLLLRGTHRHEDHAGVAAAMTEDQMRQEMLLMKEMGVNFIRLGHYQQSRIILDLCDSLGILVWEEIPWCRGGLGGSVYRERGRQMLTNMIEQHYNHPSVIIWGLGNENDWPGDFETFDRDSIRSYMRELNDLSHRLDPGRKTAIRRCDFCKDIVDVYSPSIWAGWYRATYTDYKEISRAEFEKVDHFLHVEWGGDSHAGRHSESPDKALQQVPPAAGNDHSGDAARFAHAARGSKDGDWSESYICNLIEWHLREQETMPWLTGTAQWPFKDFSTPVRPDNPVPYMNQKGVVERDLTKKEAYYLFQSYWTDKPMAHIYGHSMPVRWGDAGEARMIKVYSNCPEAELFVNGSSLGVRTRNSQDFPAAGLRWNAVLREGPNEVRVRARRGATVVEDSLHFEFQTAKWGKPARVVLERVSESDSIVTIQARVLDDKGVLCLDAAQFIRFGLAGDGRLLDNLGTPSGSRAVQLSNGRALIRIDRRGGRSVASAQVATLPTVFLNL